MLFLDQEKAYDRVDHAYLWKMMSSIGVPESFIEWTKAAYYEANVIPLVNGKEGEKIPVRSGVRQGDPLSCPLFLISIEGLARLISESQLQGLPAGRHTVRFGMFADDTFVVLRSQQDADDLQGIMQRFERASGAKVNWQKSYVMNLSGLEIIIDNARVVSAADPYKHLGVPVGLDNQDQIDEFWDKIVRKTTETVDRWITFHLSIKGRLMAANTLVMSLPRYAIRFLELPKPTKERLEKEYFRLLWDGHRSTIKDLRTCLPRN